MGSPEAPESIISVVAMRTSTNSRLLLFGTLIHWRAKSNDSSLVQAMGPFYAQWEDHCTLPCGTQKQQRVQDMCSLLQANASSI